MAHGASLNAGKMSNQQRSLEQEERPTTILCRSRAKRPEAVCPAFAGEDIVCAHVKTWGVRFFMKWGRTGAATRCEQKRMKQLMAGGGIALVGATLIPLLSGLFG